MSWNVYYTANAQRVVSMQCDKMNSQDESNIFHSSMYLRIYYCSFLPVTIITHEEIAEVGFVYSQYKYDIFGYSYMTEMVECVF